MIKKDKTCICIISHCNNDEKKILLLNTIDKVKELDLDILLYSNRVKLDSKYQKDVDYYLFDDRYLVSDNKLFYRWMITHNYKLINSFFDFGYSVAEQVKMTCNYLLSIGYEHVIFINYDIDINENDIKDIKDFISDDYSYDGISYYRSDEQIDPILFMFDIRKFYNYFNVDDEYFKNTKGFEYFMNDIFSNRTDVKIIDRYIKSDMISDDIYFIFSDFSLFPCDINNKLSFFIYVSKINEINLDVEYGGYKIPLYINELEKTESGYYKLITTDIDIVNEYVDVKINYNNIEFNRILDISKNTIQKL